MAPNAVDLVIAGHDRHRFCLFDRDLEIPEIDFPQRPFGNAGVIPIAVRLLVVAGEMLGTGGFALALHAPHHRRGRFPGEQRVFGKILEVSPAEGIAVNVHARSQLHIHAVVDHLLAHLGGKGLCERRVPGAGQRRAAGDQGTILLQTQPRRTVGGNDGRNALLPQAFDYAAERARVTCDAQVAAHHAVTARESLQLLIIELGDEFILCDLPELYIDQLIASVSRHRDLLWQPV